MNNRSQSWIMGSMSPAVSPAGRPAAPPDQQQPPVTLDEARQQCAELSRRNEELTRRNEELTRRNDELPTRRADGVLSSGCASPALGVGG